MQPDGRHRDHGAHSGDLAEHPAEKRRKTPARLDGAPETAFGSPRDFLDNRLVYLVVSARARGLSVGVNMNPDKNCNFSCVYCEVPPDGKAPEERLNVDEMAA